MSFYNFRLLSAAVQLRYVLTHGTYLAQRWDEEGGINLYHCPDAGRGFFAEVGVDETGTHYVVLRRFVNAAPLEDYAHYVCLPEFWRSLYQNVNSYVTLLLK